MTLHCPKCDYDLTGLAEQRCPECGNAFDRLALEREQSIRRPRWWAACLIVLVCAYAPFAVWIPFQEHIEWVLMWPVMPGFYFGFLLHPRGPAEFIVMGVVTLVILGASMYLAARRWWILAVVCTLLTLWTSFMSWGGYGVSRM